MKFVLGNRPSHDLSRGSCSRSPRRWLPQALRGPGPIRRPSLALAITAVVCAALASAANAGAPRDERMWDWPMSPRPAVVRTFDAPDPDWQHGHRGVDLLGQIGAHISAIGAGTVSFVGAVGGNDVVVVTHGTLRSTYQPVLARVHKGEHVKLGQLLGSLELAASHCLPHACLHLGVLRGETYLDPLDLLGAQSVRLLPLDEPSPGRSGPAHRPVVSTSNAPNSFSRSAPEPARPGSRPDALGVALRTLLANYHDRPKPDVPPAERTMSRLAQSRVSH
jgi:hypothetical protein